MTNELKEAIEKLVAEAKASGKVFGFGDEVYTPDEAEGAMLAYAESDMEAYGLTVDEYIARQRAGMYTDGAVVVEMTKQSCDNGHPRAWAHAAANWDDDDRDSDHIYEEWDSVNEAREYYRREAERTERDSNSIYLIRRADAVLAALDAEFGAEA